jgi:hypothetical protein
MYVRNQLAPFQFIIHTNKCAIYIYIYIYKQYFIYRTDDI